MLSQPNIDVNLSDLSGVSPLWAASQTGHHQIVELLLKTRNIGKLDERKGADPNLAKFDGCTPLWIASSRGNTECVKLLIKYGADVNKEDRSQGATPLFVAGQNGKKQTV